MFTSSPPPPPGIRIVPCRGACGALVVRGPLGATPKCWECRADREAAWRRSHRGELKAYRNQWISDNREHFDAVTAAYTERTRESSRGYDKWRYENRIGCKSTAGRRDAHRKRKYGITRRDYETRLAEQGGVCAICLQPPVDKELRVDHDHQTGAVRGLLCDDCNVGIGRLHDSPVLVLRALGYLRAAEAKTTPAVPHPSQPRPEPLAGGFSVAEAVVRGALKDLSRNDEG